MKVPASEGGFQGYSRVHGLLPYPEATVTIKMHLLEDHEVQWANTYHRPFGTGGLNRFMSSLIDLAWYLLQSAVHS